MLKLTGTLEVFQNKKGYVTGVMKAWDDNKTLVGKAYMDVNLPESISIEEGQTLTLDVKEAYLNAVHVEGENAFTKLKINVVEAEIKSIFPEKKAQKPSKKVGK